jgi:hypothetical protein
MFVCGTVGAQTYVQEIFCLVLETLLNVFIYESLEMNESDISVSCTV